MRQLDTTIPVSHLSLSHFVIISAYSLWVADTSFPPIYLAFIPMITSEFLFEAFKPIIIFIFGFFILSVIAIFIKKGIRKLINNRKYRFQSQWLTERQILEWLKNLKPNKFEEYISHLYSKLGYSTTINGGSYDGGVDVVAEKDGIKFLIQCKRYNKNTISVHDIRDFYGAMAHDLVNGKGIFVTTNIFSKEAERFAEGKPIELIDGFKLINLIKIAEKTDTINLNDNEVLCPDCGGRLVLRGGKYGKFYGCSNFPKCKFSKKFNR